jgi:hypothetical protein
MIAIGIPSVLCGQLEGDRGHLYGRVLAGIHPGGMPRAHLMQNCWMCRCGVVANAVEVIPLETRCADDIAPLIKKMAFLLGNGFVLSAETRTPYLHHADNNWMGLDLFGTLSKRTGRKASAI